MNTFNLIDSPWIPVRWNSNSGPDQPPRVSLAEAFNRSKQIADLDCAPHERIALTRLLVCITHAALGAPEDSDRWDEFGDDLETAVPEYLRKPEIYPHFNLLGDGPRFLQEELPSTTEPVPSSKLFPSLATGNNPTLLDHGGMFAGRVYGASEIALALLTFQNFYPLYGAGYKGRGPCSDGNAIHSLLVGKNLRKAILLNLLDEDTIRAVSPTGMGKPIWECKTEDDLDQSTRTYLGRLVPRHRSLRLTPDLQGFYHRKDSLQYAGWEPYREPSVTIVLNRKEERRLLPARINRSIWRDLHSLTTLDTTGSHSSAEAPAIFQSHIEQMEDDHIPIWTGALVTDLKAKILDTVESSFTVPHQLFSLSGRMTYQAGIDFAQTISQKLFGSVKGYWGSLKHENPPTPSADRHYWHQLDQDHTILIHLAGNPDAFRGGVPAIGAPGANDKWTECVRKASIKAFEANCPRSTPRQIQAYANAIKPLLWSLYPKEKKSPKSNAPDPS